MTDRIKKFVEDNIEDIQIGNFDPLFLSLDYTDRILFAEVLLTANIDFTGEKINKFKYSHIADFLNDVRINKSDVTIKKGPFSTTMYEVRSDQYLIRLPKKNYITRTYNKTSPMYQRYKLSRIDVASILDRYSYGGTTYNPVLIFDI